MVIDAPAPFPRPLGRRGELADVAPVIVAQQDGHVVRHPQAQVVILLDFLVQRPDLGTCRRRTPRLPADDFPLIVNDFLQQRNVFGLFPFLSHRRIAVTAHADGDQIFRPGRPAHAFGEKLVQVLLVLLIVPRAVSSVFPHPFLVIAGHGLVMGGSHDNAHLVGRDAVQGVVGIEGPAPHGRPEEIGFQAQKQLEHMGIELMATIVRAEAVFHPGREAGCLVVEENAPVAHSRLRHGVRSACQEEVVPVQDRHVGPIVPGRDADLLGQLIDAVNGTAHVGAGDNQGIPAGADEIGLKLPLQGRQVHLALGRKLLDHKRFHRSSQYGPPAGGRCLCPAHAGKVFPQIPGGDLYALGV